MPFPSEHSCRLIQPSEFSSFRRANNAEEEAGKRVDVIYGIRPKSGKKGGRTAIQALRYPIDEWSEKDAREHCMIRGGEFHPAAGHSISVENSAKATVTHDLTHSKLEENLAARSYRERAIEAEQEGDKKSAKLLRHIAKEEDVHEREFKQRLEEI